MKQWDPNSAGWRTAREGARRRLKPQAAFTLLEVLLALSMSTLLIGSVYWALAAAFDAHRRAERVVEAPRAMELALDSLRSDLRGVLRPGGALAVEFASVETSSGPQYDTHSLVLYTATGMRGPAGAGETAGEARAPGLRRVEWTVDLPLNEPLTDRHALLRRVTDNLLAPVTAEASEQVIAMDVQELSFRFYDGSQWQDAWSSLDQGDALPAAVEVTLALHDPQAQGQGEAGGSVRAEEARAYRVTRVIALPAGDREAEEGAGP